MKFEDLIKENKEKFTQTDLLIIDFIINNEDKKLDLSINDLAKKCLTSRTSILRFSKKLGFDGYSEFKYFLNKKEEVEKPEKTYQEDEKLDY
ncbi:MAG: MurR/RpiR family transcriptional regulator, partial [Anaerococcus sp.]|nr:MurR/RpiR family transcriptional regulator [Anaerococcus sp.]